MAEKLGDFGRLKDEALDVACVNVPIKRFSSLNDKAVLLTHPRHPLAKLVRLAERRRRSIRRDVAQALA